MSRQHKSSFLYFPSRIDGLPQSALVTDLLTCLSGFGCSGTLPPNQSPWDSPDVHFLHFQKWITWKTKGTISKHLTEALQKICQKQLACTSLWLFHKTLLFVLLYLYIHAKLCALESHLSGSPYINFYVNEITYCDLLYSLQLSLK